MRYFLEDFQRILETTNLEQLSDSTIDIINTLATQVGAPEYIKTPQFKSKNIVNTGNSIRRRKKFQDVNDDDWETIRTFQTTEFQKKEGLELNIHKIRKLLNMLTEKTYNKLAEAIIEEVQIVISTKTENDVYVLCDQIYNIVSGNISKSHGTPSGTYSVKYKEKDAILKGADYACPVKYWMPFNGNIGMHDASWRSKFGSKIYTTNGSHGCINMPTDAARKVFQNIEEGIAVVVY